MEKLLVNLENCYGIKNLHHEFNISNGRAFIIYAPNGAMKTSFAKVFADISQGKQPSDLIFPQRTTKYSIEDEKGNEIEANSIFVIEPYQENFNSTRTATLLVNNNLRLQYENAIETIEKKSTQVVNKLSEIAQFKKGIQQEITTAFGYDEKDFLNLLENIASIIKQDINPGFEKIVYTEIFNDKVIKFLSTTDIRKELQEYINRYDELINKSSYFRSGLFDHNNASNVCKSLKDNGFFAAEHKVLLTGRNSENIEVVSQSELDSLIIAEKKQILNDPELLRRFEAIDKEITRNVELRQFRAYIESNPFLIPELLNLNTLREKLWLSYCHIIESDLLEFSSKYQQAKQEIAQIIEKAKKEVTEWQNVVSIFHDRFSVPFSLEIANQDEVILKDVTPTLVFKYNDQTDEREIGREELLSVLSTGEKRALYLLNIIFDIQAFTKDPNEKVLILDDIADSFDYKNKYAIVEYIKSILDSEKFILIILTHNFDFFRTVQQRLGINRTNNCLMADKSNSGITLKQATYLNPFNHWKKSISNTENICTEIDCNKNCKRKNCNQKIIIALIPMMRNLIEYIHGTEFPDYTSLTSLLHIKNDTDKITISDLVKIVNGLFSTTINGDTTKVIDIIYNQADLSIKDSESINFENKIILSIAIRLKAEELMIKKINDNNILNEISHNQTRELFNKFKVIKSNEDKTITLLEKVVLMTPETIHLNSFMYEPILDMSDNHLRKIYMELCSTKIS